MRTRKAISVAAACILCGLVLFGCAATESFIPVSDSAPSFELGGLSFPAPAGDGWEYMRDSSTPMEFVLFARKGPAKTQGFIAAVTQLRVDRPVVSEKELLDDILQPFLAAFDSLRRFEVVTRNCDHDATFARVGLLCFAEGSDYRAKDAGILEPVAIGGHAYAFVDPNDDTRIVAIEYYERGLPGRLSADTKRLATDFARSVKLRK